MIFEIQIQSSFNTSTTDKKFAIMPISEIQLFEIYLFDNIKYILMRVSSSIFNPLLSRFIFRKVDAKIENKIGFIYLDSPQDLNALSEEMKSKIVTNVKAYEANKDVKVIVFLSKVKKAFCAGANIKEF